MRRLVVIVSLPAAVFLYCGPAAAEEETASDAVVREEKVFDVKTGKVVTERVIEFPEAEILPNLSRPVTIIISRQKPDFDKIAFTIFNNEPPLLLPEVYRAEYYNRIPVKETDVKDKAVFDENGAPPTRNGDNEPPPTGEPG